MPGKRSKRKKVQHFFCPYCQARLWRTGSPKHFLFYTEASQIYRNTNLSRKDSALLATQGAYVDSNCWIEDFFCGEHGKLWMKVTKNIDGVLVMTPATSGDWEHTTGTIRPDVPNPSVSEFTYRMSRQAYCRNKAWNRN